MPTAALGTRVEAIPGTPLPYGLLSAASVLNVTNSHELLGIEWLPMSCAEAFTTDWCVDGDVDEKTFDSTPPRTADPVTVYYGRDCSVIGQDFAESEEYVRAGLNIGEQAALEAWFMEAVLAPNAVDVTPSGTAVSLVDAMMTLEAALAIAYAGVGVLHVPAGLTAGLGKDHQLVKEGGRYTSWLGNNFALGAGYQLANAGPPESDPATTGEYWMYATGPVVVRRESPDVKPTKESESVNIVLNDRVMLAERTSVVSYECVVVAVLTNGETGGGSGPVVDGSFLELEDVS